VERATSARRVSADPGADLEAAERHGVRLVVPESEEWPHFAFGALERLVRSRATGSSVKETLVPPLALWVRGNANLAEVGTRSVGVVGARASTPYGSHVTAELSFGLASQGVAVVSGGAYGIDAAAHRAALAANGVTIVVSAGGVDRPYPPSNAMIFDRALENGAVVSERNRVIAALSTGVVVVEAGARSGARNTASHAVELGRPLMAVPGPVTSPMSVGCHQLINSTKLRAILVTGWEDILSVVGAVGQVPADDDSTPHPAGDVRDELDQLDPVSRRIFDGLLTVRHTAANEIASRCGIDVLSVIRALPGLELAGLIEGDGVGYRLAQRVRAARVRTPK
jgi:DNA processing protein